MPGTKENAYSRDDLTNAAADARMLMENCKIIPKLVSMDIIARRLFLYAQSMLTQVINQNWTVEKAELVLRTLGMSAQEKAVAEPATAAELHQQVFELVIPILDIGIQMERDYVPVVSGNHDGDAAGVGKSDGPVEGHAEREAGECGEGDRGEAN